MKKKRLFIYFCICLALLTLLGISFLYLRKLNALEKNSLRVDHSYQVIIQTNLLEQNLLNAETSQRGYLLTENPDFLESYLSELKSIPYLLFALDSLSSDNPAQAQNLDSLREVINKQVSALKENMAGEAKGDSIPMRRFQESGIYMNRIRDLIAIIKNSESDLLSERSFDKTRNTTESKRSSFLSLITGFVLCCLASVSIIWFFNRSENYRTDLENQVAKLTVLNAEIKELALASAHNLQEPMRKVQMIIDWLQYTQSINDPVVNERLNRIKDIYSRQQLMNNKIIEYYDILLDSGEKVPVDLNSFITGLQQKNSWAAQFELGALKTIWAIPAQLEILFTELVNNAVQFQHPGRPLRLSIVEVAPSKNKWTDRNKNYYCIAVSDNGLGVAEEFHTKIFDLFQKMENGRENKQSGMGLSFCKRIMLNHGGQITVGKNTREGLTLLLYFPQKA